MITSENVCISKLLHLSYWEQSNHACYASKKKENFKKKDGKVRRTINSFEKIMFPGVKMDPRGGDHYKKYWTSGNFHYMRWQLSLIDSIWLQGKTEKIKLIGWSPKAYLPKP